MKAIKKPIFLVLFNSLFLILSCTSNSEYKGEWVIESIDFKNDSESGMAGIMWANILSQNTPIEFKDDMIVINNSQKISYKLSNNKMIFDSGDTLSYKLSGSTMKLSRKDVELNLKRE